MPVSYCGRNRRFTCYGGFDFIVERLLERPALQLASEQVRFPEGIVSAALGIPLASPENHVVKNFDIEGNPGLLDAAGLCEGPDYGK
jgi:hypothetical protein